MSKQQKLSERLHQSRLTFTGDLFNFLTREGLDEVIFEVSALEAENERLKGERTKTEKAGELLGSAFNNVVHERDALRAELKQAKLALRIEKAAVSESENIRVALRAEVEQYKALVIARNEREDELTAEVAALRRDVNMMREHDCGDAYNTAIRERDDARAELERVSSNNAWLAERYETVANERDAYEAEMDLRGQSIAQVAAERDAVLVKLEQVRRYANGWYPEGMADYTPSSLLAILDAPAPTKAGTKPVNDQQSEQFEVVQREVVLSPNLTIEPRAYDAAWVGVKNGLSPASILARAPVTFHVKRETPKPPRVGEALRKEVRK